ncbi:MAG: GntR family transcriptional regulator [Parvibaculaceae bacterium]
MASQLATLSESLESPDAENGSPRLAAVAYEQILDAVIAGKMPGGTVIQERLIARHLNLSRTPVREAVSRLEGEGILKRVSPRVLMVNRVSVAEVLEIIAVRRLLEVDAVGAAVGKMPTEEIAALGARVRALLSSPNVTAKEYHGLDDEIHEGIARASGNQTLLSIIADLRRRTAMFDMRRIPERFRPSCEEHLRILDAIERQDRARAQSEIAIHLDNVRQSILRRLSGGVEIGSRE